MPKPGAKNVISVVWGYLYEQSIFVNFDKVNIRTADLLARNKEETVVMISNIYVTVLTLGSHIKFYFSSLP